MKIEHLYYFREAVKWKSLSVAAEKNFISQPALSSAISKLEKELNVTLLHRNRRGVAPTKEGILILEKVNDIFSSLQEIEDIASHSKANVPIILAAMPSICDAFSPALLSEIHAQKLPYELSLFAVENHVVYQQVSTGMAHLGVVGYDERLMNSTLQFKHLFNDEYLLYVGPKSPLWEKESVTREEFMQQPYIAFGDEFLDSRANWSKTLFENGNHIASLRSNNTNSIRNIILHDNYVAFFPKFSTKYDVYINQGLLKAMPLSDFPLPVKFGCLLSKQYKLSGREKAFTKLLEECVTKL
ncbi:MAG: LysR family transcriptional regulator [Peptococcaceae bacterium]|nr:LysR family transcriptional regulator [Peptococcaceae bacterium]